MTLSLPPALVPGDTIGICALSGTYDPTALNNGIQGLEQRGFKVHVPHDLNRRKRYLAGGDVHRATVLTTLFTAGHVQAILCARGGFGALRTLPLIDFDQIRCHPKRFVGFSDATAFLVSLVVRSRMPAIHGPVLTRLGNNAGKDSWDALYRALTLPWHALPDICADAGCTLRGGRASGRLIGGNLATLCHLCGTGFQPACREAILFLEEINEPPYKIDRMLTQMSLAGMFQGLNGVILGRFQGCGADAVIHEIMLEHMPDVPIFSGLPCGHGRVNIALPMGVGVTMDADQQVMSYGGGPGHDGG